MYTDDLRNDKVECNEDIRDFENRRYKFILH